MEQSGITKVPATDLTRWRLDVDGGRHNWRYVGEEESKKRPLSIAEKYFLGFPTVYSLRCHESQNSAQHYVTDT
jgi:hypothetical protein